MHQNLDTAQIMCPYCGEHIEIVVDCSVGNQNYVEDCQICCAPIDFAVEVSSSGQLLAIQGKRDRD